MVPSVYMLPSDGLPLIKPLCQRFFAESGHPGEFNWEHFSAFWGPAIAAGIGRIYVDEGLTGMIGAAYMPDPFTGDPMTALSFWYVSPESRGTGLGVELFNRAEKTGLALGSKSMIAGHLLAINKDGGRAFFERRGFVNYELGFRKIYG